MPIRLCLLTTKDYAILQAMLELGVLRGDPIAPLIQRKLSNAAVVSRDDIDPRVATLKSRVIFRVDNGASDNRILIQGAENSVVGMTIPINVPRGLALLGAREREDIVVERPDGSTENIHVEEVAFQPEAHQRHMATGGGSLHGEAQIDAIFGREGSTTWRRKPSPRLKLVRKPDDFDPGPSAA